MPGPKKGTEKRRGHRRAPKRPGKSESGPGPAPVLSEPGLEIMLPGLQIKLPGDRQQ